MTDVSQIIFHTRLKHWLRIARLCCAGLILATVACAQGFFPLKDVRPGLHGVGKTVFQGNTIGEFQVEILGVMENLAPQQSIILAKLTGGPLADTGILQGMSGSPIYIDGKLLGAVALGFPFSKDSIAGIQPIEQMITEARFPPALSAEKQADHSWDKPSNSMAAWDKPSGSTVAASSNLTASNHLVNIQTPLSLSGFTPRTLQEFAPEFRKLGFEPQQGISAGSPKSPQFAGSVEPGSMISVQVMSGDMVADASGTVTYVDGKRVYAFGHRFLAGGPTEFPFARAEVLALLPNLNSSFKISAAREWVGTIVSDRSTAIAGEIGRQAHMIPMTIAVRPPNVAAHEYHIQVVNDRLLTSLFMQAALFSSIDATERTLGSGTIRLSGRVEFEGNLPPLLIKDVFIGDSGVAVLAASNAVVPLGFVMGAGFNDLHVKGVTFELEPMETKRQLQIEQVWTSSHDVKPGESIEITALLSGENGLELTRTATYQVPIGAPKGPINFTLSDANTLNFPDFAGLNSSSLHTAAQLIQAVNGLRGSDQAYIRVWRQEPSFSVSNPLPGGDLTDPPPSIALILAKSSASASGSLLSNTLRGSQVAELSLALNGYSVTGAKTVQVEVKE